MACSEPSASHEVAARLSQAPQTWSARGKQIQPVQQPSPVTPSPRRYVHNQAAFTRNAELPSHNLQVPTQSNQSLQATSGQVSTPGIAKLQPIVLIPPSSAKALQSDFVTYEETTTKIQDEPRKRRRYTSIGGSVGVSLSKDQRAASDETFRRLEEVVQDIFEADDQSQSNPSRHSTSPDVEYFVSVFHDDREINALAPAIQVKLESSLQKVILLGRLSEIPADHLQRLQGLCEGALTSADSSDLQIEDEWNSDDFGGWVQRLEAVDLGLRSARTIMRIMIGGRSEKVLYSEELLQGALRVVQKAVGSCIIPIVEARSSVDSSNLFQSASTHKKVVSQLLYDTDKVMGLLAKLLAKEEVAETIITTTEFLATRILFVENAHNEKDSVLGIQKFEILRRTAMDIIAIVFSKYPEQRTFLFDEILTSVQKLPIGRQAARQFKLTDGKAIQLVTALIMRLVQASATHSAPNKSQLRWMASSADDGGGDDSYLLQDDVANGASDHGSDESDESDEMLPSNQTKAIRRLGDDANSLCQSAAKNAQYVVWYLVQRAQTSSKTGDQPHRQLLDIFVEDLIAVLGIPEWPAAELLLRAVLAQTVDIIEKPKSLAPAKNMALELLGIMGSAISDLVSNTQQTARSFENHHSVYSGYLRQLLDDYMEGSLESSEILIWSGPYHAVVERLHSDRSDDLQMRSARGYCLAQWAKAVSSGTTKAGAGNEKLAVRLRKMISGAEWFTSEYVNLMLYDIGI